jgi:ribose transport system substrate-binding protein
MGESEGRIEMGGFSARAFALIGLLCAPAAMGVAAQADDFMDQVKADVQKYSGTQTDWRGPTSGPRVETGKHIVYMSSNQQNDASQEWGRRFEDVARKVGWTVTTVDGHGSPLGWQQGMNQAIALKPDGIILEADAVSLKSQVLDAQSKGIPVVGIHSAALPGPQPDIGMFVNVQQDPREIGKAQADWIILHSGGKARVVVTGHCEYAIACTKSHATEARLKECPGCEVLEYSNTPIAEAAQRQPALVTAWVQKYGMPLYITSVADYTADYQIPALRAGGVDPKDVIIVSADGNKSAYARIRAGDQYQLVTASESFDANAYQLVDELNRAFHKMPPSGYVQTPFLVTPDNIHADGGDQNTYIPSSDYAKHYMKIWGLETN